MDITECQFRRHAYLDSHRVSENHARAQAKHNRSSYAFNDIDYLAQVTPREGQSEHATSFFAAISPVRILFKNSFLFQSIYVRLRLLTYAPSPELSNPYENNALLNEHFRDLDRFVSLASTSSTLVTIVPFNIGVVASKDVGSDYNHFVKAASAHGLQYGLQAQRFFRAMHQRPHCKYA